MKEKEGMWNDRQEFCRSSIVIISAERTTNRSHWAIRGSERSARLVPPDHECGGAMYDRRSRQPITPQHLITPLADRCRVVRDFLTRMPITRSACWLLCVRGKKYAWSTRSVNISLKTTFIFCNAKKIVCIKSEMSIRPSPSFFVNFKTLLFYLDFLSSHCS